MKQDTLHKADEIINEIQSALNEIRKGVTGQHSESCMDLLKRVHASIKEEMLSAEHINSIAFKKIKDTDGNFLFNELSVSL